MSIVSFAAAAPAQHPTKGFDAYWRRGKAELNRFRLLESRYGELHRGHAVLVFVVEDMRPDLQVKDESADPRARGSIPVMKLNRLERFTTGIYDYSMMLSVFVPLDLAAHPLALKATASVQEWCGQVWEQLNLGDAGWRLRLHSYFEKEHDREATLARAPLEDALLVKIRLDPAALPVGDLRVVPGLFDSRLRHREPKAVEAKATLEEKTVPVRLDETAGEPDPKLMRYTIEYPALARRFAIVFERAFPHRIQGFEDAFTDGRGRRRRTAAVREKTILSDYWNRRFNRDAPLRAEFGLAPLGGG